MKKRVLYEIMLNELDWYVIEFLKQDDVYIREVIDSTFKGMVKGYNAIIHRTFNNPAAKKFPLDMGAYIDKREADNWE